MKELDRMEILQKVFDTEDKEKLKREFPYLYYAILDVLDEHKKPDASGYFNT